MDVEMERQGLPTTFATSPEADKTPHEVTNIAALASNAETASLKPVMPSGFYEPVASFSAADTTQPPSSTSEVLMKGNDVDAPVNGNHVSHPGSSEQTQVEDNLSIQHSQLPESSTPVTMVTDAITTTSALAPEESSVLPTEVVEAVTEVNLNSKQTIPDIHTEPTPMPEQPISDLRSAPLKETNEEAQSSMLASVTESISTSAEPETSSLPLPPSQSADIMSQTLPAVMEDPALAVAKVANAPETKLPSPPIPSPSAPCRGCH